MSDLRELLQKFRKRLGGSMELSHADMAYWCQQIDAALSESVPELSRRVRAWIRGHMSSYGAVSPPEYEEECVSGEDQPEGEGWIPLYASPPPASPSDARDAARWRNLVEQYLGTSGIDADSAIRMTIARINAIEREGGANG